VEKPSFIKLDITTVGFSESSFLDRGYKWDAKTLYEFAEELPEFDLPLAGIDLNVMPWNIANIMHTAEHVKRVLKADFKYPILLDEYGFICDGWHRVVKALLAGKTHIRAKRLLEMPDPDAIMDEEDEE